jgi:hypothetical protein
MSTYKPRVPYSEYRKRKQALRKAQEQERARKADEKRQEDLTWAERSQKLIQAKREHPIAYFFGNTDVQQEIFGKTSITNSVLGLGNVTKNNPTGRMGWLTGFLLLLLFFPLLLLSIPSQLPFLQIISFVAIGIELYRYEKGKAFEHEWKVVLGVITALGWIVLLSLRSR